MTNINLNVLDAIALASSTEETRYYLNGVCVIAEPRSVTYVATNGKWLAGYFDEIDDGEPDNQAIGEWVIPIGYCRPFKLTARDRRHAFHAALTTDADGFLTFSRGTQRVSFRPVDGTFPAWRRVVPVEVTGEVSTDWFDGDLARKLDQLGDMLGVGHPSVTQNGAGPALARYRTENLFAIIMPGSWRNGPSGNIARPPAWVKAEAPSEKRVGEP